MAWVKLDDSMPTHPKMMAVGVEGFALDVAGIAYCNRYETNGFITDQSLGAVLPALRSPGRIAEKLVAVGRWSRVDGGWQIHDYLEYQPSRESKDKDRSAARERMRRVRANDSRTESVESESVQANKRRSSDEVRSTPARPLPVPTPPSGNGVSGENASLNAGSLAPKPARARDEIWDALIAEGFESPSNASSRGRRNKAVALLRESGATPDQIHVRVQAWPIHYPGATLTDMALANRWDELGRPPARASKSAVDAATRTLDRRRRIDEALG